MQARRRKLAKRAGIQGTLPTLPELARHVEAQLNLIQRRMRQTLQAEIARGQLTGPQRLVMEAIVPQPRPQSEAAQQRSQSRA